MNSKYVKNAGYLLALVPQLLLVAGVYTGFTWLSVVFFFALLPLVRLVIGNDQSLPNSNPSNNLSFYLNSIPRLYFVMWVFVLAWTVWILATVSMTIQQYIGFTFSLWIVCSLNTAIAHELTHFKSKVDRSLGDFMDASVGYFHFTEEHRYHHARNGHYHEADIATPGTSIYAFAFRRYVRSLNIAFEYEHAKLKRLGKTWLSSRLLAKVLIPVVIAAVFFKYAGVTGLAIYLFQIAGAAFSVQAITYLQHWGLSEKETPEQADFGFSWDDGCWMQACVTLNHAFHGQHHLRVGKPFYEMSLIKGYLSLPASYPVMFVVALFPALFTRIMEQRLSQWVEKFKNNEDIAHEDDCIGASRIAQAMRKT